MLEEFSNAIPATLGTGRKRRRSPVADRECHFNGRERRRLRLAREDGYLDARCRDNQKMVRVFGFWCWRLRIPSIWFERRTPHSRYGRLRLDMATTANMLTVAGQAAIAALAGGASVSPHDACWDRVPLVNLEDLARAVFMAATTPGNYEPNRAKLIDMGSRKPSHTFNPGLTLVATA